MKDKERVLDMCLDIAGLLIGIVMFYALMFAIAQMGV